MSCDELALLSFVLSNTNVTSRFGAVFTEDMLAYFSELDDEEGEGEEEVGPEGGDRAKASSPVKGKGKKGKKGSGNGSRGKKLSPGFPITLEKKD